jgi:lipopolysaccharide cholinephosphotransferase
MAKQTISSEELKEIQIQILQSITDYCEKNDLRYFLAYGSLIGAVRHKGFIPWDDDLDIMMPRPDFEKFCAQYKDKYYEILSPQTDDKCFINFAKVHDIRTRYQESYSKENNYGIFVDIFPIDGYIDNNQKWKCYILYKLIHYKRSVWNHSNTFIKNLFLYIIKFFLLPIKTKTFVHQLISESKRLKYEDAEFVYYFTEKFAPLRKSIFEEYIYASFENRKYRIPKDFDELLKIQYGDYMKLPPEKDRINVHHAKIWWK